MAQEKKQKKIRVFAALPVSTELQAQAETLPSKGLVNPRWTHPADLHITLRFIGDLEPDRLPEIQDALRGIKRRPFHVEAAGLDCFENRQVSFYASVQSTRKLTNLAIAVTDKIRTCGFEFPIRPFVPHVTLARMKTARGLDEYITRHGHKISTAWKAGKFCLYRSAPPGQSGQQYKILEEYFLQD